MISYNKEQNAWDFREATDEEKQILCDLGEQVWAQSMAAALAKRWMEQEKEEFEAEKHNAVARELGDNIVALNPKKAH